MERPPQNEAPGRFEYYYFFPDGEIFEATENQDGTVFIVLDRNGENIVDFSDMLPEGYRFARHSYYQKMKEQGLADVWVGWGCDHKGKLVDIDDFESPKDILTLLHEIGHAWHDNASSPERTKKINLFHEHFETFRTGDLDYRVLLDEEMAKVDSVMERRAWAYAVQTLRALEHKFGIDFQYIFPNFKSVKEFIDSALSGHRESYEVETLGRDPDFENELRNLFDRKQYQKPQTEPSQEKNFTASDPLVQEVKGGGS